MRLNEITSEGVSYEEALREAAKVKALTVIATGDFDDNTARTVLSIAFPNHSYNELEKDWNKAVKEQIKKQKFVMGIRHGKV